MFDLEHHSSCEFDYLMIGNTKYCGTSYPPPTIDIQADSANLVFFSDTQVASSGFFANWYSIDASSKFYLKMI